MCLSCAPLPPSLLYLSIIKLARFSAAGVGRGLALFERRLFKSLQTNGTGPRSAVTKPTPLSRRPELPACLPPSSPSSEFRRDQTQTQGKKKEGETARRDTWQKATFFSVPHFARWLVYEEQPRWDADINKRLRWRETPREHSAAGEGSSPARP